MIYLTDSEAIEIWFTLEVPPTCSIQFAVDLSKYWHLQAARFSQ